jgi:TolB-like protein
LLVGLPIVLTLAWYHGDKGEQRVTRAELGVLTLLLLLGGGIVWTFQHRSAPAQPKVTAANSARTSTPPATPSVAVLPFENRSRVADDAFFVDGIHDDILTQLSKVSALKVISRTSVEQFRDTKLPTRAIAEQLGVRSILEGGVQRAGDRVRINVQLIDAATDTHLWAETYDRELTAANIFAIQSEVSAAIAGALKAALTPAEKARVAVVPTQKLQAWEAYQLGKQRMAKRTSRAIVEAEQYFQKAIDLDPRFALAYVGLGDVQFLQIYYTGASTEKQLEKAEAAVKTALELDPGLGEAWTSSANLADWRRHPDQAEAKFRRAIELSPNYATAHQWFGEMLWAELGRREEGLAQVRKAVELDPLSVIANVVLGQTLESVGRFAEAENAYRKAIEIDPSLARPYGFLGSMMAYTWNHFADAVSLQKRASELDPGVPEYQVACGVLYFDLGEDTHAARLAGLAQTRWPESGLTNVLSAAVSMVQGDLDAAMRFARANLAVEPRSDWSLSLLAILYMKIGDYEIPRALYEKAYPEFFAAPVPVVNPSNFSAAIGLVPILLKSGATERARALLDQSANAIRGLPRLGAGGIGLADVRIHALRGSRQAALAALREAEKSGWRGPFWRYARDFDPTLASIRNEPEFKAIFADIERDMARPRAELAARPKDAPLDLASR